MSRQVANGHVDNKSKQEKELEKKKKRRETKKAHKKVSSSIPPKMVLCGVGFAYRLIISKNTIRFYRSGHQHRCL